MACREDQVFNPISGRCVSRSGPTGRLIARVIEERDQILGLCEPPLYYDPVGRRCVHEETWEGRIIKRVLETRGRVQCPAGMVLNPRTGRCVSARSALGQAIAGRWNCQIYGERPAGYVFEPREQQIAVSDYIASVNERGILLYWSLGSGKTCGAIMAADKLVQTGQYNRIYVLSTGSLRENFLYQYCQICGEERDRIRGMFDFISYNYSFVERQLPPASEMDNSIIVIDEVHNIINGYLNESENYVMLYNLLVGLRNVKFILLSGTPVMAIRGLYYLMKLLRPDHFQSLEQFLEMYREEDGRYVPTEDLREAVEPVISRVSIEASPEYYPEVQREMVTIPMTTTQYIHYLERFRWEEEQLPPNERLRYRDPELYKQLKAIYYLAISLLQSRQRCNMYYPEDMIQQMREGIAPPDRLEENGGWIPEGFVDELSVYSPKFFNLLEKIEAIEGKHVVYSQFKVRYGIRFIHAILNSMGIPALEFTGDMNDAERAQVLQAFNHENNLHGERYKVLLVTEAGREGQSFTEVRAMHIMEQSINEFNIRQIMGRGVRFGSHLRLPEDERNITIYRYFALTPGPDVSFEEAQQAVPQPRLREIQQSHQELRDFFVGPTYLSNVPEHNTRETSDFYAYFRGLNKVRLVEPTIEMMESFDTVPESFL